MSNNRRILITGSNGYIGSVMAPWLRSQDYDVVGLDTGYFSDCTLVPDLATIPTIRKDLREVTANDLVGFDAVIHLAALSNDPIQCDSDRTGIMMKTKLSQSAIPIPARPPASKVTATSWTANSAISWLVGPPPGAVTMAR